MLAIPALVRLNCSTWNTQYDEVAGPIVEWTEAHPRVSRDSLVSSIGPVVVNVL